MKSLSSLLILSILASVYSVPYTKEIQPSNSEVYEIAVPSWDAGADIGNEVLNVPSNEIQQKIIERNPEKVPDPRFSYVGIYEGRSYYRDETPRTWLSSKAFCENLGMELAAMHKVALWNFIWPRIPSGQFYWTASKDSQHYSQFNFFLKNGNYAPTYVHGRYIRSESCVAADGSDITYWSVESCTNSRGVLCQNLV